MPAETWIEVKPSPLGGKGTFATKTQEPGDVLLALDRPLIVALDKTRLEDTCSWCLSWTDPPAISGAVVHQAAKVSWCTGCKKVKYCSKQCQARAWKAGHKHECKNLAAQSDLIPSTVQAVIRMMEGLSAGDKRYQAILELETHREDFEKAGGKKWDAMQLMAHTALTYMQTKGIKVEGESAKMSLCVLICNSGRLVTPTFDPLGLFFDPQVARINHSCEPNAIIVFDGPKLTVRALTPLLEGSEVLISYIDSTAPFGVRQAELKDQYFFTCQCTKCQLGRDAPQEALLKPGSGFEERIKVIDDMIPNLFKDPAWPRHFLGDSTDKQRLTALQFYGYSYLDSPDGGIEVQDLESLRKVIQIIQNTGVWPFARQPLPALYQQYAVACLRAKRYNEALIAMLRIHVLIDPDIYPQPHHPVRIVHSWALATLSKAVGSNPETPFCQALQSNGVDLSMLFLALLFEVTEQVSKSHGTKSIFGETVGGALQAMMEPGGELDTQFSQIGVKRDQWPKIVEDQIKVLWPKVIAFTKDDGIAQQIDQALEG